MATDKSKVKVITEKAILSYPHLDTPQKGKKADSKSKYSAALVFLAGTNLTAIKAAIVAAAVEKYGEKAVEMLRTGALKNPLRTDAEAKGYPAGATFLNVRSDNQPGCVYAFPGPDGKKPALIPQDKIKSELYPGAIVRASIVAFTYDTDGNKGVSFALNNIQKIADGDRLDSRVSAEDEFEADLSAAPADLAGLI